VPDPCSEATFEASRPSGESMDAAWRDEVRAALEARKTWITPRQTLLQHGRHSAQRVGSRALAVQWRYEDGQMLSLEINLGPDPVEVPAQHLGPVEAQCIFRHRWPEQAPAGRWPAWAARWSLGAEITL
jgi:maltooligosyltrehalose trehalohydrolase